MPAVAPSSALSTSWTGARPPPHQVLLEVGGGCGAPPSPRGRAARGPRRRRSPRSAPPGTAGPPPAAAPARSRPCVRSSSTTSIATRFTSKVAALASTSSCTTGIMKIWNTVVRSRKIWRNSFRTRKKMVRIGSAQPDRQAARSLDEQEQRHPEQDQGLLPQRREPGALDHDAPHDGQEPAGRHDVARATGAPRAASRAGR